MPEFDNIYEVGQLLSEINNPNNFASIYDYNAALESRMQVQNEFIRNRSEYFIEEHVDKLVGKYDLVSGSSYLSGLADILYSGDMLEVHTYYDNIEEVLKLYPIKLSEAEKLGHYLDEHFTDPTDIDNYIKRTYNLGD